MVQIKEIQKYWFVLFAVLYKAALDWSYIMLANSSYSYEYSMHFSIAKLVVSFFIVILISGATLLSHKPSVFLFRLIITFSMIPLATVFAMRNESTLYFLLVMCLFFLVEILAFFDYRRSYGIPNFCNQPIERMEAHNKPCDKKGYLSILSVVVSCLCVLFAAVTIVLLFRYNGVPNLHTLKLENVYSTRESYKTTKYLGYMTSMTTYVLVPLGVSKGVSTGRKSAVAFWFAVQFILFCWTGHKTWLFSIALLVGVILIVTGKISERRFFSLVLLIVVLGCITANSRMQILRRLFSLINRRVLLNPASLKYFYYDYFVVKGKPLAGTGGTLLAPFFHQSSAAQNYATTISQTYTGVISNANTGLYGGDFANIGGWAFFATPLLLLLLDWMITHCSKKCGIKFAIILFAYMSFSLNDQSIVQYFLDFKGIALIFIVLVYRMTNGTADGHAVNNLFVNV